MGGIPLGFGIVVEDEAFELSCRLGSHPLTFSISFVLSGSNALGPFGLTNTQATEVRPPDIRSRIWAPHFWESLSFVFGLIIFSFLLGH